MFIQTIESQKKSTSGLPCTLNLGASLPVAWQCPLIVPLGQVPFVDGQITYCKKKNMVCQEIIYNCWIFIFFMDWKISMSV